MTFAFQNLARSDPSPAEDAELIGRFQADPARASQAFTQLYRGHVHAVYYYLVSKVGNPADAEDLTGQVFLEVLEGLNAYRHQERFTAWLFTIARRRAVDFYRRRKPAAPIDQAMEFIDLGDDPLSQIIHREDRACLSRLIAALKEDEQELLRLRFAGGLSFGEIAGVLKRKEPAVKMAYYRLLERLESQMEQNYG